MTDRRPDVTAIVIAHQVRHEVLPCLTSIQEHAGALDVEIILVDNGSTDGTVEAVAEQFPDVQVVALKQNVGIPARNEGLRRARGRHRLFLDSDAMLTPGALETLVSVLDEDPSIGLVGPRLQYTNGSLQLSCRRFPPMLLPLLRQPPLVRWFEEGAVVQHHLMADAPHDRRRRVEYVIGACMLFSERAQHAAGEIDERIWFGPDDADWCFKIREAGLEIGYEPAATVIHKYRRTSRARPLSMHALRHLRAFVMFQRQWAPRRAALKAAGRAMDAEARAEREAQLPKAAAA